MRKPNLIDMAFNDKAKSNTQNFIIGTLLTQFKSSKLNNEKQITEQLEAAPSIKDLKIAEQLKRLRDFNQKGGGMMMMMMMMMMMIITTTTIAFDGYLLNYHCIILPHLRYLKTTMTKLKKT